MRSALIPFARFIFPIFISCIILFNVANNRQITNTRTRTRSLHTNAHKRPTTTSSIRLLAMDQRWIFNLAVTAEGISGIFSFVRRMLIQKWMSAWLNIYLTFGTWWWAHQPPEKTMTNAISTEERGCVWWCERERKNIFKADRKEDCSSLHGGTEQSPWKGKNRQYFVGRTVNKIPSI